MLAAFRATGHLVGEAYANCAVGMLRGSQGRHSDAIAFTSRALSLAEAFSANPGMEFARLTALNNIAWLHARAGLLDEARSSAAQALVLLRQAGDPEFTACALDTLGFIQHHLGDNAGAVRCFRAALDLFASVSSLYKSADTAEHLADAYQALGDPVKARAALRDTLAILDKLGHPHAIELGGKLHALDRRTRPAAYRASTSCSSSGTR